VWLQVVEKGDEVNKDANPSTPFRPEPRGFLDAAMIFSQHGGWGTEQTQEDACLERKTL
jgi:hypothetical protein